MLLSTKLSQVLSDVVNASMRDRGPIAVAFSGGIDSSLLATVCKKNGVPVTLLTIGFPQSHDVCFSQQIASKLNLDHRINMLEENDFYENLGKVIKKVDCENISHIENCIAFFILLNLLKKGVSEPYCLRTDATSFFVATTFIEQRLTKAEPD